MAVWIILITLGLFATRLVPEYLSALLFFTLCMLFDAAPAAVVFSGFDSGAFWLVLAGLVIGLAINTTGLGHRIAGLVAGFLNGSYARIITGMVLSGFAFAFFMPSAMGRCVLLIPIAMEVAHSYGFSKGSNGYNGITLAVVFGSFLPAFSLLPANVSNMILVGMTESVYGYSPLYAHYLQLHFPVLGLGKAVLIILLILWLFPDTPHPGTVPSKPEHCALSRTETLLAGLLVVLIGLWITDFIHHISPAWVAMAGAVILMLPRVGIVSKEQFAEKINFSALFFVAGVMGLGGVIHYSGMGKALADWFLKVLPLSPDQPFINYICICIASVLTGIVTTLPGIPAVLTPIADSVAHLTGFSVQAVAMLQVFGFSTIIFPYQSPPIIFGAMLAGVSMKQTTRMCICLAGVSIVVLMPLDYLWWLFLGWI